MGSRSQAASSTRLSACYTRATSWLEALAAATLRGADASAVTVPDIEAMLLAEEKQAQWDADDLVKVLEDVNRKREELARTSDKMRKPCGKSARRSSVRQMRR